MGELTGRAMVMHDFTCGVCRERFSTNESGEHIIRCPECGAARCPECQKWIGGEE